MKGSLAALLALSLLGCRGTLRVTSVTADTHGPGVYFALPKAEFVVRGEIRTTATKPPVCKPEFALKVGLEPRKVKLKHELKGLSLATRAVIDETRLFSFEVDPGPFQTTSLEVALSPIQSLTATKSSTENQGWAFATSALKASGGLIGSVLKTFVGGAGALAAGDRDGDGIPDGADRCPDTPENPNGLTDDDGCPDASQEACQWHVERFKRVLELRQQLVGFGGNVGPENKEVLTEALAKIELELEAAATPLIGEREVRSTPFECRAEPRLDLQTVLAFDSANGTVVGREGVCVTAKPGPAVLKASQLSDLTIELRVSRGFTGQAKNVPEGGGLPYRIPARALAVLRHEAFAFQQDVLIPQFGAVRWLQASLDDALEVKLDGDTGALTTFSGKQTAPTIDAAAVSEGVTSVMSAVQERRKQTSSADAEADEAELKALERRVKKLEAQKKILELESD